MSSNDAPRTGALVSTSSLVPPPIYRHAAPSGPWPWVDFNTDLSSSEVPLQEGPHEWSGYPQNLFGNWTSIPVKRSEMLTQCATKTPCIIYGIDVTDDGQFKAREQGLKVSGENETEFWSKLNEKVENVRVRAWFVDKLTESVLKMLGTRYNIEPFFFSSSTHWIPSRYQEAVQDKEGDHITVILPFIGTTEKKINKPSSSSGSKNIQKRNTIDVMAPLHLHGEHILLIDLLAIHMIREKNTSTIITYHSALGGRTTAERLYQAMRRAGGSVYWKKIFKESKDPTFFFLEILWYALYAWDEAFEVLYLRIKELEAILNHVDFTSMADRNHSLHSLQAHLLHYQTLLHDFNKSVVFVKESSHPAFDDDGTTKELMKRECNNLLSEIDRLERKCSMFISRLKNATELAFAAVNIEDTKATLRDSAAMKQISYLTMIFLPASFTASVFGMNVVEINPGSLETIARYVEPYSTIHENSGGGVWRRMAWPFYFSCTLKEYFGQARPAQEHNTSTRPVWGRESSSMKRQGAHEEDKIGDGFSM